MNHLTIQTNKTTHKNLSKAIQDTSIDSNKVEHLYGKPIRIIRVTKNNPEVTTGELYQVVLDLEAQYPNEDLNIGVYHSPDRKHLTQLSPGQAANHIDNLEIEAMFEGLDP
jgi:hypothetical protein